MPCASCSSQYQYQPLSPQYSTESRFSYCLSSRVAGSALIAIGFLLGWCRPLSPPTRRRLAYSLDPRRVALRAALPQFYGTEVDLAVLPDFRSRANVLRADVPIGIEDLNATGTRGVVRARVKDRVTRKGLDAVLSILQTRSYEVRHRPRLRCCRRWGSRRRLRPGTHSGAG